VERKHAACVNSIANIHSTYRWQGKLCKEEECLLVIKSTQAHYTAIQELITANHPYELPEIIAVPISVGLDRYLAWIHASVDFK
jgi:periplasmic divalent cation tolerance protein